MVRREWATQLNSDARSGITANGLQRFRSLWVVWSSLKLLTAAFGSFPSGTATAPLEPPKSASRARSGSVFYG
eukprot:2673246-Alexandrium_andersonii.AAC.1